MFREREAVLVLLGPVARIEGTSDVLCKIHSPAAMEQKGSTQNIRCFFKADLYVASRTSYTQERPISLE